VAEESYGAGNIKILEGIHAVRKRPGMYIGDTGLRGLHHLVYEIVDNSIDEASAGYGKIILIEKTIDNQVSVQDAGRGIPVAIHPQTGLSSLETVLTVLHAGGKFDQDTYKVSGGLHGVGSSVTNALSEYMIAEVCREGKHHKIVFKEGETAESIKVVGECKKTGTKITFKPDKKIFKRGIEFDDNILIERFREVAFLNKGLKIIYRYETLDENNEIIKNEDEFNFENGVLDFVKYELKNEKPFIPIQTIINNPETIEEGLKRVEVEISFTYIGKSTVKNIKSFTNNIPTPLGGDHENAFTKALYVSLVKKMNEKKAKSGDDISIDDAREGIIAIVSISEPEPEFEGQTKGKLNSPDAYKIVYSTVRDQVYRWLEENPKDLEKITKKVELAKKAREAAKKSREAVRKSEADSMTGVLPTKLADCQSRDPEECEIYLVEGDSAGGSAKQSRDRKTQAILPLKGKILNVYKHPLAKVLKHTEVGSLITAMGCGIGNEIDLSKIRYHKIIIMTDADIDGGHIKTLLFYAFYKYWRPLIEKGYLYIAVPPLYRMSKGDNYIYFKDDQELDIWVKKQVSKKYTKIQIEKRKEDSLDDFAAINECSIKDLTIEEIEIVHEKVTKEIEDDSLKGWLKSRFKGLGEMNPDQLKETAMDPKTRVVKQVVLEELEELYADEVLNLTKEEMSNILELLGGEDNTFRRWFLLNFTKEIGLDNLDL